MGSVARVTDWQLPSNATALRSVLTLLLIGVLLALSIGKKFFEFVMPQDEGILLLYPDLILRGYVPYRDFVSMYPPGNLYLIAGAFYLFGVDMYVERSIGVAFQFLMAMAVYFLGCRVSWATGFLAAAALIGVLHFFPWFGAYPMFGALSTLLFALLCANMGYSSDNHRWVLVAGILTSLTYWFRQDFGIVGTLAAIVVLQLFDRDKFRVFLIGFAGPAIVLLVFIVIVGPASVFDSLILDVIRAAPGRGVPFTVNAGVVALILCVVMSVVIALSIQRKKNVRKDLLWLTRGIAIVSVGLLPSALQRADIWHLSYVGCAVAGLTIVSLGVALLPVSSYSARNWIGKAVLPIAVTALFGTAYALDQGKSNSDRPRLALKDRWVFADDGAFIPGRISDARSLLEEIDQITVPGEGLFIGPADLRFSNYNDTFLYYLLPHLQPVSRYLEMNPGSANRGDSGLAAEIASADWLILTSRYRDWNEQNESRIPGSAVPNEIVNLHFCLHSEHGVWRLLRRCERTR
jgi:hypothetical protein